MVFSSSLPPYLDPPNWPPQQPTAGGGGGGGGGGDHEFSHLPPPLLPPPPPVGSGLGGGSTVRPVSMSERARMAKMPQPEAAMKCPRCESTNTKFCYFNNYSLSQPRHFCKTCRRYWTRGGALRNVPVGGGCRRNKRSSKGSRSKSPATITTSSTSNSTAISTSSCSTDILGHLAHPQPSQFPILPPLHHLADHFGGGNIGLAFGGGNGLDLIQIGNSGYPSSKFAQFPFFEASNGSMYQYQFEGGEGPSSYINGAIGGQFGSKTLDTGVHETEVGGRKMEEEHHHHQQHLGLNLSRNFLGISGNDQFLGTSNAAWSTTDLTGFTSSSVTTHLL